MEQEGAPVQGNRFFVFLARQTMNAHQAFVKKFKSIGHTEVNSLEECHYQLVICPVVSRVGVDIQEALAKAQSSKPIILVVMHHTFNPKAHVPESRRHVEDQNVRLTVDCLFYEGKLLQSCNLNDSSWWEVQRFFGVTSQVSTYDKLINWVKDHRCCTVVFGGVAVIIIIIATVVATAQDGL